MMTPWILGAAIGIVLALANFVASIVLSYVAIRSSKVVSIALLLGTFLGRLGLIFLVFLWVAWSERIELSSALLAFATCFTILLIWEVLIYYRKFRFLRQPTPPGIHAQ
jgi:hypothetical protein